MMAYGKFTSYIVVITAIITGVFLVVFSLTKVSADTQDQVDINGQMIQVGQDGCTNFALGATTSSGETGYSLRAFIRYSTPGVTVYQIRGTTEEETYRRISADPKSAIIVAGSGAQTDKQFLNLQYRVCIDEDAAAPTGAEIAYILSENGEDFDPTIPYVLSYSYTYGGSWFVVSGLNSNSEGTRIYINGVECKNKGKRGADAMACNTPDLSGETSTPPTLPDPTIYSFEYGGTYVQVKGAEFNSDSTGKNVTINGQKCTNKSVYYGTIYQTIPTDYIIRCNSPDLSGESPPAPEPEPEKIIYSFRYGSSYLEVNGIDYDISPGTTIEVGGDKCTNKSISRDTIYQTIPSKIIIRCNTPYKISGK